MSKSPRSNALLEALALSANTQRNLNRLKSRPRLSSLGGSALSQCSSEVAAVFSKLVLFLCILCRPSEVDVWFHCLDSSHLHRLAAGRSVASL